MQVFPGRKGEGNPKHIRSTTDIFGGDRTEQVMNHHIGFFSDKAVGEDVVKVILLASTEVARLCRGDVGAFIATPGR
jgi:hypothetical protein